MGLQTGRVDRCVGRCIGRAAVAVVFVAAAVGSGCTPAVPRPPVTFAVVAGVYYSATGARPAEPALVEASEDLLQRAVADINRRSDVDFVLVAGDLLAGADPLSLDRAKAILDDLRPPYLVVLGEYDGPAPRPEAAPRAETGASPVSPAAPGPPGEASSAPSDGPAIPERGPVPEEGAVATGETAPPSEGPPAEPPSPSWRGGGGVSRSTVLWAFQGHGIAGPDGFWAREVRPGVVVVGLDTVRPGLRGGHVGRRQLEWLDRTLATYRDKMVIVVGHHGLVPLHPLDEGSAWRHLLVDNAAEVLAVLERHPNVVMAVTAHHHLAGGQIAGRTVFLASPSLTVWPMAYHLVSIGPERAEAVWVPVARREVSRRGLERLLADPAYRGVFPPGEDGDTACVRLFGGNKRREFRLPTIRP